MADILLRGFEMPTDASLWLLIRPDGTVYKIKENDKLGIPKGGAAVPLPEGHGRLGDLDALEVKFREEALEHTLIGDLNRMTLGVGEVIDRIRMADTIVPAEGGTDECSEN